MTDIFRTKKKDISRIFLEHECIFKLSDTPEGFDHPITRAMPNWSLYNMFNDVISYLIKVDQFLTLKQGHPVI